MPTEVKVPWHYVEWLASHTACGLPVSGPVITSVDPERVSCKKCLRVLRQREGNR